MLNFFTFVATGPPERYGMSLSRMHVMFSFLPGWDPYFRTQSSSRVFLLRRATSAGSEHRSQMH